jgi:hypothetical protein
MSLKMLLVICIAQMAIGTYVGIRKDRPILGLSLGFFLGLIGIAIVALIPAKKKVDNGWG